MRPKARGCDTGKCSLDFSVLAVRPDEAFVDPISRLRPGVPSAQGTLTGAIAWEQGAPVPRWYERNDTRIYARLFRTRVLHLAPDEGADR